MTSTRRGLNAGGACGVLGFALLVAACGGTNNGTDSGTNDVSMTNDSGSNPDAAMTDSGGHDAMTDAHGGAGHDFASATAVSMTTAQMGTLVNPMTQDYYTFTAQAGDRFLIGANAQMLAHPMSNTTDATVIDTVVTVYNSSMTQIAQDDDPWPRTGTDSVLFFKAPTAGTYYVAVGDCNAVLGASSCAAASGIRTFHYQLTVAHTNQLSIAETNAASTQDGTTAQAQALTYTAVTGGMAGQYQLQLIDGDLANTTSRHVYSFTPPTDVLVDSGQRARAEFWVQPTGTTDGDGSTSNIRVWVTDSTGSTILAQADESNFHNGDDPANGALDLSVPVTPGTQYYLFVQNAATTSTPATDYYFVEGFVGSYFYGQTEGEAPTASGTNDTQATALGLTSPSGVTGAFFVDGDIATPTDVDWFSTMVPSTATHAFVDCQSAREGAGTRGFTYGLYNASGTLISSVVGPEANPPVMDLTSGMITIPSGTTMAFVKVSATAQDATVTGTSYRCQISYQ